MDLDSIDKNDKEILFSELSIQNGYGDEMINGDHCIKMNIPQST